MSAATFMSSTESVSMERGTKAEAEVYLEKAEQFFRTMKEAQENEDWDAVGMNAIHCVISSNDALLGFRHGIRSASGSHADAVELLGQYDRSADSRNNAVRLDRMLKKKHLVEYDGRSLSASELAAMRLRQAFDDSRVRIPPSPSETCYVTSWPT